MKNTKRSFVVITLALIVALLLVTSVTAEIVYTNQVTVAWDAVEKIVETDVITYEVFAPNYVGETAELMYTLTFLDEGEYVVGVRAKRVSLLGTVFSDITWSDVDGVPEPFVIRHVKPIEAPKNIKVG